MFVRSRRLALTTAATATLGEGSKHGGGESNAAMLRLLLPFAPKPAKRRVVLLAAVRQPLKPTIVRISKPR